MISVHEAEQMILSHTPSYGVEEVAISKATGRVLAEDVSADRDLPPWNRPTVDGIAIRYADHENGIKEFKIIATLAAGATPVEIAASGECVEIMTGGPLPQTTDTVVRYEDLSINDGFATIHVSIKKGQNIHPQGIDKKSGEIILSRNTRITSAHVGIMASVGKAKATVYKLPSVAIITTGNELVAIDSQPTPFEIRRSNDRTIHAILSEQGIEADMLHIPDDPQITGEQISICLKSYDVLLLCGGVSMGKYDHVPQALEEQGVRKLFHKVQQRPGKPFWFGRNDDTIVFAFPGNPVSVFLCLHRYFLPWLDACRPSGPPVSKYAVLDADVTFAPALQYFAQVTVYSHSNGTLMAKPAEGHGSGDFSNLAASNAFIELPLEKERFSKGEAYPIWPFKQII
jgi:molybdopterin molybdotransferase